MTAQPELIVGAPPEEWAPAKIIEECVARIRERGKAYRDSEPELAADVDEVAEDLGDLSTVDDSDAEVIEALSALLAVGVRWDGLPRCAKEPPPPPSVTP